MFQSKKIYSEKLQVKRIEIDQTKSIRKVSMCIWGGNRILGLRLIDNEGKKIVDNTWWKLGGGWITYDIPVGEEIIGIRCNVNKDKCVLTRLSFLVWRPNLKIINQVKI